MNPQQPDSLLMRTYQSWLARLAADLPTSLHEAAAALFQAVEAGHVCIRDHRLPIERLRLPRHTGG